jgi:hypothetical protein
VFDQGGLSTCELVPNESIGQQDRSTDSCSDRLDQDDFLLCCQDGASLPKGSGVSVDDRRDQFTPKWLSWSLIALVGFSIAFAVGVWWHLLSALP